MSPPIKLIRLQRRSAGTDAQIHRMRKHYDMITGRVAVLVADLAVLQEQVNEKKPLKKKEEANLFVDYQKVNELWSHTAKLKANWYDVVGTSHPFPPMPNGLILYEQLNLVERFLVKRFEYHRRQKANQGQPMSSTGFMDPLTGTPELYETSFSGLTPHGDEIEDINNITEEELAELLATAEQSHPFFRTDRTIIETGTETTAQSEQVADEELSQDDYEDEGEKRDHDDNNQESNDKGKSDDGNKKNTNSEENGRDKKGNDGNGDKNNGNRKDKEAESDGDDEEENEEGEESDDEDQIFSLFGKSVQQTVKSKKTASGGGGGGSSGDDDSSSNESNHNRRNRFPKKPDPLAAAIRNFRTNYRQPQTQPSINKSNSHYDKFLVREFPSFSGDFLEFPEFLDLFMRCIDRTDLPNSFKLIYLKKRVDRDTWKLIRSYNGREYNKALQIVINRFTSMSSVMNHVKHVAHTLPKPKHASDVEGLADLVERLRQITTLFSLYNLDSGFEMEIFRCFYNRIPQWMSDTYMKGLGKNIPKLEIFLHYLDEKLEVLRTKRLYELDNRGDYTRESRGPQYFRDSPSGSHYHSSNRRSDDSDYFDRIRSVRFQVNNLDREQFRRDHNSDTRPPSNQIDQSFYGGHPLRSPCASCDDETHSMLYCQYISAEERLEIANEYQLCLVCLRKGHFTTQCRSQYRCAECYGRHSSWVCVSRSQDNSYALERDNDQSSSTNDHYSQVSRPFNKQPIERIANVDYIGYTSDNSVGLQDLFSQQGRIFAVEEGDEDEDEDTLSF